MVVGKNKKILLFICTLTLLLLLICYKSFDNRRGNHAENIVIFLEKNKETKTPYILEKEIILNNIKYYFDYSIEKKTILCLDMHDKFIEKNVVTNDVQELTILEFYKEISSQNELRPARLQYESDGQEITFALEDSIYNYNILEKKLIKKVENIPFYNEGQYKWTKTGKLYYTIYEHPYHKLYMYNKNKPIPMLIDKDIWNFDFSKGEEKIYFVASDVKNISSFGIELGYELGEISLEDKKIRIYQKYNFENRILKSIDDTYVFYVNCEKNFWGTKINKIYCVEIESGKSWCIYKTFHSISDIIIDN